MGRVESSSDGDASVASTEGLASGSHVLGRLTLFVNEIRIVNRSGGHFQRVLDAEDRLQPGLLVVGRDHTLIWLMRFGPDRGATLALAFAAH